MFLVCVDREICYGGGGGKSLCRDHPERYLSVSVFVCASRIFPVLEVVYERSRAVCACCDLAGLAICRPAESTFLPLFASCSFETFNERDAHAARHASPAWLHVHVHVMCENSGGPAPACRLPRHATHHTPAASAGRASDHHRPATAHSGGTHTQATARARSARDGATAL